MNDLITVKRHWREWDDPRFIVLVLQNEDLNQVSWELREAGDPRWDVSQLVDDMDYAAYAEMLGLSGLRLDAPDAVDSTWERAFRADRPVLVDARTDKNVPPLPPHVTLEQATGVAKALLGGDPDGTKVVGNTARALAAHLFARFDRSDDE